MLNRLKKFLSHRERLETNPPSSLPHTEIGMPKVVSKVVNGRIVQEVQFVTDYNPQDNVTVNDFALENLLACGANLSTVTMSGGSSFHDADTALSQIESINYKD